MTSSREPQATPSPRAAVDGARRSDHRRRARRPRKSDALACFVRCTDRYTRAAPSRGMTPTPLLTLADWAAAYDAGARPGELLGALQRRLERESPPGSGSRSPTPTQMAAQVGGARGTGASARRRAAARPRCRCSACRSPSRTTSTSPASPTTAACPAFAYRPAAHAHAVARLIDAGAICLGKTNLDQFATGLVGTRSPYGRPSSAFAPIASAAARARARRSRSRAAMSPFALGTDTAGSGRVPAGFNNIVGLKPTPGRVGTSGVVPACRSLDCVSILRADGRRCGARARRDRRARRGRCLQRASTPGRRSFAATLRVGIPRSAVFRGDAGYGAAYETAIAHLQALGHRPVALDFAPLHARRRAAVRRAVGRRAACGGRALLAAHPDALDRPCARVIERARAASARPMPFAASTRCAQRSSALRALWSDVDVLMVPTAPGHPRLAEVDADPIGVNAGLGTYTNFVNLLGWCALALPAGFTASGLPFGVTFIAPASQRRGAGRARRSRGRRARRCRSVRRGVRRIEASATVAPAPLARGRRDAADRRRRRAPARAAAQRRIWSSAARAFARRRAPRRATACTRCPARRRRSPAWCASRDGGVPIEVEVWDCRRARVGSFLALDPAPLGLGSDRARRRPTRARLPLRSRMRSPARATSARTAAGAPISRAATPSRY